MTDLRGARILVTGATGFIGGHLVNRLLGEGALVSAFRRAGVLTSDHTPLLIGVEGIDWHEVDLRAFGAVSSAVQAIHPDLVFHLAATGSTQPFLPPDEAIRGNLYGAIHLLRAVNGAAPVVVARTPGERDALNIFTASKAAAWEFCTMYRHTQGWPIVGLMPFHVYGPGQSLKTLVPSAIRAALRDEDFPMTHGEQQRDYTYVGDIVDACVRLGRRALDGGWPDWSLRPTAPGEVAHTLEVGTGRAIRVREMVERVYQLVAGSGRPRVGALPGRPGEVQRQVADPRQAEERLGWQARTALDDGLHATIEWLRAQRHRSGD